MAQTDAWADVKALHAGHRVTLGEQASYQWLNCPEHLAMVLARYRAAAALIGNAPDVVELGCGEGIGAGILAQGRRSYYGLDNDGDGVAVAHAQRGSDSVHFLCQDVLDEGDVTLTRGSWDAVVALDVIEHIPTAQEGAFMGLARSLLYQDDGICVIGTPNATAWHLGSAVSKAGHINNYSHDRLFVLMNRYFKRVQSFGMQDTSLHLGHPEMRHYLMMVGIGPRQCQPSEGSFPG